MRLKYQLFLILLTSSVLLIALLATFNSWAIDRGFSRYVVQAEKQRLSTVIDGLIQAHEEHAGWEWLESEPSLLRQLIAKPPINGEPPIRRQERLERLQEAASAQAAQTSPSDATPIRQRRPRPPGREGGRQRPLLLLDHNRQLLVGEHIPQKHVVWEALASEGETIGYLGIRKPRGLPGDIENVFIGQQLRSNVYAAFVMVFLSALLAIACASRMVKPIVKVNKAVGLISDGDYSHQIDDISKDEIGDLSNKINQLANTLKSNQTARRQWMAEISHELRTPVAVLQGELEAMQDGIRPTDRAAIDSLHSESTRLGALINDLHQLTLSDIGALEYSMSTVDLLDLVQQRVDIAQNSISEAGLSVSVQASQNPLELHADAGRLEQLVDNLLQNSVRYTDASGEIRINLSRVDDAILLDWSDSAPGVSDEQLTQLFEPLYRTDESRNRNSGGSGLGLSVVKKIVNSHQGSLTAYHSDSGGLGVRVRFPQDWQKLT